MRPDLGAFLQHDNRDLFAALLRQLAQADSRGQPGRAGADDHNVNFHAFAFHETPCP